MFVCENKNGGFFWGGGILCAVLYIAALGIYTRTVQKPIIFFASIVLDGMAVGIVCFAAQKIMSQVYDGFTVAMVAMVYFIAILFFAVFGPTFIDRSISYHIAFYAAEEESICGSEIEEAFSKEIFEKRLQDAVQTGFLQEQENGYYLPTWKSKVMANILIPLGKLTNSLDTYEQMKRKLSERGAAYAGAWEVER